MWMKLEQQNKENEKTVKFNGKQGGNLLKCPMCKGRGFFEPTHQVPTLKNSNNFPTEFENDSTQSPMRLPQLMTKLSCKQWQKPRSKYSLPSINNVKNLPEHRPTEWFESNEMRSDLAAAKDFQDRQSNSGDMGNMINKKAEEGTRNGTQRLSLVSSSESTVEGNLIPSPKSPKNPPETLKSSLTKLKSTNWNDAVSALKEIVQLARFHPQILEPSMIIVYRGVIALLKSFRSMVVRTACQAANELFATMANTQRPEFDEVVSNLLQRTADSNKCVRQDANEALDTMIINIPHNHSVRAIMNKGIGHKSPLVRSTSARLFVCLVGVVGLDVIFTGSKEARAHIFSSGASFIQDGNQEVRNYGKRLMKMLMKHEDFDEVLQAEVADFMLRRIEKTLVTMKYKA